MWPFLDAWLSLASQSCFVVSGLAAAALQESYLSRPSSLWSVIFYQSWNAWKIHRVIWWMLMLNSMCYNADDNVWGILIINLGIQVMDCAILTSHCMITTRSFCLYIANKFKQCEILFFASVYVSAFLKVFTSICWWWGWWWSGKLM